MSENQTVEVSSDNSGKVMLKEFYMRKLGCTQFFKDDGTWVGVTVLEKIPSVVLSKGTSEKKLRVAYLPTEKAKLTKVITGQFKGIENGFRHIKELIPMDKTEISTPTNADIEVAINEKVCVQGTSIGKGFQGVMKKWHFSGGMASHGAGPTHRSPGSIGMRTSPGRVFKNKKLAGQMGNVTKFSYNLLVSKIQDDLVFLRGSVPGSKGSIVKLVKVSK